MKKNLGSLDRIIRLIIGLVVIVVGIVMNSWWGLIGVLLVLTSFFSFCPLYVPLKINTIKKK